MQTHLQPVRNAAFRHPGKPTSNRIDRLFQQVKNDDYFAFEKIFRKSYRSLCSYSNQLVICPELAEEIVDDVFCSLWEDRKKIHITTSFQSYLIISIRNRSLDCLRKMKGKKKYLLEDAERVRCKQLIASEKIIYEELRQQVDTAVKALPAQCRRIFQMSREQDFSYKEIANKLNISIKTVDTQIGRALKSIRKSIACQDR
jgi:RNA polymerase sigma-70 factor (ECF subfamily)